ncbi:lipopolysaccharide biosynthesis protein [Flindersiella endophytica]
MTGARGTTSLGSAMIALTGARLASVVAVFLAGVIAARLLDPAAVGVAGVGLTVGWAVAIIANGGLNISVIYFLGRRPDERALLIRRFAGLGLLALVAGVAVTAAVAPFVTAFSLDGRPSAGLFAGAAVLAAATIGYELAGAGLLGLEQRRPYVLADILRSVATLGLTVVLLALVSRTAEGYVLATGLGVAVPAVFALVVVRRRAGRLAPSYDRPFSREALKMGLAGQLGNVLTFLNLRLDLLLVPALLRLDQAGVYFIATRVSEVVGQASTASASMLFPHVAGQGAKNGGGRATAVTERTSRLTLLATLAAAAALAAVSPWVLTLFFGAEYHSGTVALLLLLVAMLPLALARVLAADLKGRGRAGMTSIGTGIGAAVNLVANLALIPGFGLAGAAIGSVLSYGVMAGVLLACYRRVTGGGLLALLPRPSDVSDAIRLVRKRVPG